jgi:hypothetical protein
MLHASALSGLSIHYTPDPGMLLAMLSPRQMLESSRKCRRQETLRSQC